MKLEEIFHLLESDAFEFELGLASGFVTFRHILEDSDAYQLLQAQISDDYSAHMVINRVLALLNETYDPLYRHPHDYSIAVYILAVLEKYPRMLYRALEEQESVTGLFWTHYAIRELKARMDTLESAMIVTGYAQITSFEGRFDSQGVGNTTTQVYVWEGSESISLLQMDELQPVKSSVIRIA